MSTSESLHPGEYAVLNVLRFLSSGRGHAEVTYLELTRILGWSPRSRSVAQCVRRLKSHGLLQVIYRRAKDGRGLANRFTVTPKGHREAEAWLELEAMGGDEDRVSEAMSA